MLALLHKKKKSKKKRHHYWVHPLLCTTLETGQFQMASSCFVSFINNAASNNSRGDGFDIFKNYELDDIQQLPARAALVRFACGNGTNIHDASHSAAK